MKKLVFVSLVVGCTFIFAACSSSKGSFEKAGERTDEIIDNAKDGDPLLHKRNPVEKAGDKVGNALENAKDAID